MKERVDSDDQVIDRKMLVDDHDDDQSHGTSLKRCRRFGTGGVSTRQLPTADSSMLSNTGAELMVPKGDGDDSDDDHDSAVIGPRGSVAMLMLVILFSMMVATVSTQSDAVVSTTTTIASSAKTATTIITTTIPSTTDDSQKLPVAVIENDDNTDTGMTVKTGGWERRRGSQNYKDDNIKKKKEKLWHGNSFTSTFGMTMTEKKDKTTSLSSPTTTVSSKEQEKEQSGQHGDDAIGQEGEEQAVAESEPEAETETETQEAKSENENEAQKAKSENENEDEDKMNRYFVFHVGPPKAASSTIQTAIRHAMASRRSQQHSSLHDDDGYVYIGRHGGDAACLLSRGIEDDVQCKDQVRDAMVNALGEVSSGGSHSDPDPDALYSMAQKYMPSCWNETVVNGFAELNPTNILLSSESVNIPLWSTSMEWWMALDHAAKAHGYKLIVVLVYRRLYDWLPSAYNQRYKHIRGGPWDAMMAPLFPQVLDNEYVDRKHGKRQWLRWFSTYRSEIPSTIETRILNLYDDETASSSIETKFFCDMMPNAYKTCERSRSNGAPAGDAGVDEEKVGDEEDDEDIDGGRKLRSSAHGQQQQQRENDSSRRHLRTLRKVKRSRRSLYENLSQPSIYYDALAKGAADAGYVDKERFTRWDVYFKIIRYQTQGLNLTVYDFPLQCPTDDQLSVVLEASIQWERELLPDFVTDDMESQHRAAFWDSATNERTKFCTIDVHKTLQMDEWQHFFVDKVYEDYR